MIERVISGGQTGADQAGWRAAKAAGIATGGWMPKGFLTEDGPRPEFAELYGAREYMSRRYEDRTPLNVRGADLTILFGDSRSPGASLAYHCWCDKHREPNDSNLYGIPLYSPMGWIWVPAAENAAGMTPRVVASDILESIAERGLRTINVAGNRESKAPGIGAWVEAYLSEVFRLLREEP